MNRGEHKWRVKADDKFKQYFKRWEVLKSCQSKIKDYFEKRRNAIACQRNVNSEQSAHNEGSSEENLQHGVLLPLLKSEGKCGSLDDLEAKKPIFEFGRSKKRIADESWKKHIKKYKIDGFLCVPSLFKYDPIDLLRTSSDTCVRYGNYEPLVAPERRFWGVLKRNPTFPDKGGGTGVDARKVRMDPNKEPDLKSSSIKTSTSNGVPSTQKRDFQYQCRRKRSENTEKTALRVMNYCFEGHVTMPVALKSDNRRLLSIDKVCSGRDGVKKKDRQYGSNFSVKASKSHFDLTTQVLLQARSPRK
ncbi:hypothetical protein GE061_016363 [Apolygus lucorum]|uniref:Uncharacterized protein n=1 Tax=Apolygus lucorum TaxID=248454 RepID=A0A8S9XH83_APOLU|nr:hypothetical protein GE061_016363 [Apolygus lucorum]